MSVFEMVVVIVIVASIAGVANRFIKLKHGQAEHYGPDEATTGRINDLEDRIETLEKIVTDDKRNLGQEIDRL